MKQFLEENPGYNVNSTDKDGRSGLDWSCRVGHLIETCKYLLSNSVALNLNVNQGNAFDASPFLIACQEGNVDAMKLMMDHPQVNVNRPQHHGCTPLYIACEKGSREAAALLIQDPRIPKVSELARLCIHNDTQAIKNMLKCNPDLCVNEPGHQGNSPFFLACSFGLEELASILLEHPGID